ncbi:MAG: carbohydrate kinase [Alphaproteobacteria bacterium]|nr:carbohydrate kinase [Alphaproteobacteria bacterium]MBV8409791.1 carbohydrate kinase [Alphaproteobacteria bacterium]
MLLSCGDALIDFLPGRASDGREALLPAVGGSCLNVAIGLARLGAPAGFVGGLSTDLFGRMIADHAHASGVDLAHVDRSLRPTTLAFVRTVDGEAHYAFYDENTASRCWRHRPGAIPFGGVEALHVGSTTLVDESPATEALALVAEARPTTTISFDPNCRPNLVRDQADYRRRMERFAAVADIMRLSDSDFAYLHDSDDYAGHAKALFAHGASLFVVTRGLRGVRAWHCNAGAVSVEAPAVKVVDTIGAGDSFQAGLLFALFRLGRIDRALLPRLDAQELERALAFAASCAAITCTRPGADPPRGDEVDTRSLLERRLADSF